MEYHHYIPKEHFDVLVALRNLVQSGIEVHYTSGNHDFNLGTFFQEEMGMHVHLEPFYIELQGKNMALLHGDGLAASDWKYRLVKKVLIHPISNFCFKLLHPDWGMSLAKWVGKQSRDSHNPHETCEEYDDAVLKMLEDSKETKNKLDVVLHGHTHRLLHKKWEQGEYVNTGEWFCRMEYTKLQAGEFSIHTYTPQ
jgi:UDP-2,3-diacylglucosamine hydrolase